MEKKLNFDTTKQMMNWLIRNEGKQLVDSYGRRWMYQSGFWFKDIGTNSEFVKKASCFHLYGTNINEIKP